MTKYLSPNAIFLAQISWDRDRLKWLATLDDGRVFINEELQSLYNEIVLALGPKLTNEAGKIVMTLAIE
jgi:hypothetical protein